MRILESESQINSLKSENTRLSQNAEIKNAELENWRKRLTEAEQTHRNAIDQLRQEFEVSFKQRIVNII